MSENIEQLLTRTACDTEGIVEPVYLDEDILIVHELARLPEIYNSKIYANVLCFCLEGHMEVDMNGTHYVAEKGDTIVCPSGVVVDRPLVSPDFKFSILALTDRVMQQLLSSNMDIWTRAVYVRKEHVERPAEEERRERAAMASWHFVELMRFTIEIKDNPFRKEMLHGLLQIALLGYCARHKVREEEGGEAPKSKGSSQATSIFNRFLELLRSESVKHRPVGYYAEQLCITPKYLSFICTSVSGRAATSFIQTAVSEEAAHYLKNTTLSVKEIAQQMGFDNLSFFGKYVKAHLGLSPNEYRKANAK